MNDELKNNKKSIFKERINKLIKKSGKTQAQIASESGINLVYISRYASGKVYPTYEYLYLLANYFKVDVTYLTGITNDELITEYSMVVPENMKKLFRELMFLTDLEYEKYEKIFIEILNLRKNKKTDD